MAIWARGDPLPDLVHHSDRGVKYLSIRYTERLAEAEIRLPPVSAPRSLPNRTEGQGDRFQC
jgi:transposase InsO family protein